MNIIRWLTNLPGTALRYLTMGASKIFFVPIRWFRRWIYLYNQLAISAFLYAWYESRRKLKLLWGIPLIAVLVLFVILYIEAGKSSDADQKGRSLRSAAAAYDRNDFKRADLLFRRALNIDPSSRDALYGMARTAEKTGDTPRYEELIRRLAGGSDSVAVSANMEIVEHLLNEKESTTSAKQLEAIDRLERVVSLQPNNTDARLMLGELYIAVEEWKAAAAHISQAAYAQPAYYIRLAQLHFQNKDQALAEKCAAAAAEYFEKRLQRRPDDSQARVGYSIALGMLNDFPPAVSVLIDGLKLDDSQVLKTQLARTYVIWALKTEENKDDQRTLILLQEALNADANNAEALGLLFRLSREVTETGAQAKARLEERLARGDAPGVIHLLLGTAAAQEGNHELAQTHLQRALALNPRSATILNNLAWILSHQPMPDYEHALVFANQAITVAPDFPEARETRGQILLKLERWNEALADLEFALPTYTRREDLRPLLSNLHSSLSVCYQHLGESGMAQRHQGLAEEAKKNLPPPQ